MSFEPNPKQALLLWNMITGVTPEERQPMKSEAKPELEPQERRSLENHGFISVVSGRSKRGRKADFLNLTDKAWEWASHARDVQIAPSPAARLALQGLLRRLIPFLEEHELALADLFRDGERTLGEAPAPATAAAPAATKASIGASVEQACLSLAGGAKKSRVRLSALRKALPAIPRPQLDSTLLEMQRERRLVLYREDNTPALTPEDHAAALLVGGSPRHLVYLEA